MNIVICASQVPFVRGGAEELVDGLASALREIGHRVEIVSLPFKWYPRDELERQPVLWRTLDLEKLNGRVVDLVICTKFPTWAVRHPRKVVWLVHQHRQAYDWYGTPLSDFGLSDKDRRARRVVMETDSLGIGEANAVFTISKNVAKRLLRYNGLSATPLYPALKHTLYHNSGYGDYIFSLSRLDSAKRLDILLETIKRSRSGVRAIIGGAGPDAQKLKEKAHALGINHRIEFTGRISEEKAVELYAGALAVYYAPLDEDYGYATLEAMRSYKPVLTAPDSGGVLEFVENEINGYICGNPIEFADKLDRLYSDRGLAAKMGEAGFKTSSQIPTWIQIANTLTQIN
ncbi:MAG: glycosyltransferase family 4 protein [Chloroflexi bacterium]|uniref:Glycosyltransferase family 4 protein n=1 Tax=Candidatus Chlorohelix allophototropha TaxID=3003348 RepID=A0A8T7M3Q5_9CHLR|nr:glycosyltransferase family 4 protein [Chloroflexota bacterium]WJW66055.1 glycosyltransferase family 4 protein [Chloroflexota bacterium L227-S17]